MADFLHVNLEEFMKKQKRVWTDSEGVQFKSNVFVVVSLLHFMLHRNRVLQAGA